MPSATEEGNFVVQDLQVQTASKQTFTISCNTYNKTNALPILSGYLDNLIKTYVITGSPSNITSFLTEEALNTGTYNISYSKTFLGQDSGISSGLLALQALGTSTSSVPLRPPSYSWGY